MCNPSALKMRMLVKIPNSKECRKIPLQNSVWEKWKKRGQKRSETEVLGLLFNPVKIINNRISKFKIQQIKCQNSKFKKFKIKIQMNNYYKIDTIYINLFKAVLCSKTFIIFQFKPFVYLDQCIVKINLICPANFHV